MREEGASGASIAQKLAGFAVEFPSDRIPPEVIARARLHLLDGVGLAIAGSRTTFAQSIARALADDGAGAGTVMGTSVRLPAALAALVNGVAIHSDDFDDTMFEATMHPSGVVVAAGLAAAESAGATASDLLPALVVGYELLIRLGLVAPGGFLNRGFHATSVCGVYAAAAIASRLMRIGPVRTAHALGIAGSMSSGILEYLGDGSSMKRFHPGWAAQCGLRAAQFARAGADGPTFVFEGRRGLYNSFLAGEEVSLSRAHESLGSEWLTLAIAPKFYPMCHFIHAFVDCALELKESHSLQASDIAAATCFISADQIPVVCEPAAAKVAPRTPYEGKFSLQWCVAAALCDGQIGLDTFEDASIARPGIGALASRIRYEEDAGSLYPSSFSGRLALHLKNGATVSASREGPLGSAANPASPEAIGQKFRANVDAAQAGIDAFALEDRIRAFHGTASVSELMEAAATAPRAPIRTQGGRSNAHAA